MPHHVDPVLHAGRQHPHDPLADRHPGQAGLAHEAGHAARAAARAVDGHGAHVAVRRLRHLVRVHGRGVLHRVLLLLLEVVLLLLLLLLLLLCEQAPRAAVEDEVGGGGDAGGTGGGGVVQAAVRHVEVASLKWRNVQYKIQAI